jgi:hypothetical protein
MSEENKNKDREALCWEYGIVTSTPIELIEEFASQMMLQHQIFVTEINFAPGAMAKMSSFFRPKEEVSIETNDSVIKKYNSVSGHIVLGEKEESTNY